MDLTYPYTGAIKSTLISNKKVFVNGCFDILHPGHIHLFRQAKKLGDYLIVAINSDHSFIGNRGKFPYFTAEARQEILRSLQMVDEVVIFDDPDPREIIRQIDPKVIVKGDDYAGRDLPEMCVIKELDIDLYFVPRLKDYSSSDLKAEIEK